MFHVVVYNSCKVHPTAERNKKHRRYSFATMKDDLSSDITRAVISWMSVLYRSMELSSSCQNCTVSDHFPNFSQAFSVNQKWNFGTSELASCNRRTKLRLIKVIITWAETKILPDYISCFSLHFFRAQTDCCVLRNRTVHSEGFSII